MRRIRSLIAGLRAAADLGRLADWWHGAAVRQPMQAVRIYGPCGPEGVRYEAAPRPRFKADEVLIRVHAAGVNPADWQVMGRKIPGRRFPWIPGFDVCGVVEQCGSKVTHFCAGDAVYGMLFPTPAGAFAEYAVAGEEQVSKKPASLDYVRSAALPIAALTAWQALLDKAQLASGQRVLIHAAAGGVGHLAVQLAKSRGAYVFGTASGRHGGFLREIGVDQVVDYTLVRFEEAVRDVDVVLDPLGGEVARRSLTSLRKGGILISLKTRSLGEAAARLGVRAQYLLARSNRGQLEEIARLVDCGALRPHLDTVFPLNEVRQALELSRKGRATGKIVVQV